MYSAFTKWASRNEENHRIFLAHLFQDTFLQNKSRCHFSTYFVKLYREQKQKTFCLETAIVFGYALSFKSKAGWLTSIHLRISNHKMYISSFTMLHFTESQSSADSEFFFRSLRLSRLLVHVINKMHTAQLHSPIFCLSATNLCMQTWISGVFFAYLLIVQTCMDYAVCSTIPGGGFALPIDDIKVETNYVYKNTLSHM